MAGWRQAVESGDDRKEIETLTALSRSRTEPASRVSRAAMLLGYREKPSFFAVGRRLGVHHQTVQRCVEAGCRQWRTGGPRRPTATGQGADDHAGSQGRLVSLACDKAKEHAYPTNCEQRGCRRSMRASTTAAGHDCLAQLVQGQCANSRPEEIKPHKVRHYLDAASPSSSTRWRKSVFYREVQVLKKASAKAENPTSR